MVVESERMKDKRWEEGENLKKGTTPFIKKIFSIYLLTKRKLKFEKWLYYDEIDELQSSDKRHKKQLEIVPEMTHIYL